MRYLSYVLLVLWVTSLTTVAHAADPMKPLVAPQVDGKAVSATSHNASSTSPPPANHSPVPYGWGLPPAPAKSDTPPAAEQVKTVPRSQPKVFVQAPEAAKTLSVPLTRKVVIDIPSRTLTVFEENRVLKRFPVGVGRPGFMTPLGKHQIIRKIENPGWENPYKAAGAVKIRPGYNNPLGTRWMGFKADPRGEFGIHGTDSPQSVGKLSSHGCVRMLVPHAEQVFTLVDLGTPVEVTYQTVQLTQTPTGAIQLTRYPDSFHRGMPTLQQVKAQITQRFGPAVVINDAQLQAALTTMPPERHVVVGQVQPVNSAPQAAPISQDARTVGQPAT
jgi:lipoprotein-anchoring transpeptidase ErfK/SrfK